MVEFISISAIVLLAVISPGPDFALVSRNALRYSQKIAIMTSLGTGCGALFHATYCILGFAIIISQSLLLFNIVKYVGAAYLIYLGAKGLLEKKTAAKNIDENKSSEISLFQAFSQGLLCNALNPKAVCFFIALFTTLITPSMALTTQMSYGIEIALIHFTWFSFVSIMFSHAKIKSFLGKFQYYMTKIFGVFLILFGVKIAAMVM